MTEIIPAVLAKDYVSLSETLSRLAGITSLAQIDICDGKFVPSSTWPYGKEDMHFKAMLEEKEGMPNWEEMDFEFDLMIENPEERIDDFVQIGAARIVVHIESTKDFGAILKKFDEKYGRSSEFSVAPELGIALNVSTPNEAIEPFVDSVDFVQFMGIRKVGYQGQSFDERVLEKISTLRKSHEDVIISVDGGVNLTTAQALVKAGADRLIAGSVILNSENPAEIIRELKKLAHDAKNV
ncbi:MAG: hypothetical protein PHS53_00365 [Candidatus Pacebacteria bacterium]|nr:hypothetical protein [Candidatus Paceibacterota bacterium]MDD5356590.1 hypothetical protein [Candidatus Paceibacterota bacterium]